MVSSEYVADSPLSLKEDQAPQLITLAKNKPAIHRRGNLRPIDLKTCSTSHTVRECKLTGCILLSSTFVKSGCGQMAHQPMVEEYSDSAIGKEKKAT